MLLGVCKSVFHLYIKQTCRCYPKHMLPWACRFVSKRPAVFLCCFVGLPLILVGLLIHGKHQVIIHEGTKCTSADLMKLMYCLSEVAWTMRVASFVISDTTLPVLWVCHSSQIACVIHIGYVDVCARESDRLCVCLVATRMAVSC